MQNHALKSNFLLNLALGILLVGLLLAGLALPQLTVHADGGGFPTATSIPTVTNTPAAAKSLNETLPLPAPTFTSQPLIVPAVAVPAGMNGALPTVTSAIAAGSGAPVPASGAADTTANKTSWLTLPIIIMLASLAILAILALLFVIRRRR